MTSSGLWSGSISDIILRTAVVVLSQKMSITEEDIIKISKAVKAEILADSNKLIHARTEPLVRSRQTNQCVFKM
jgi:hypothetical protein